MACFVNEASLPRGSRWGRGAEAAASSPAWCWVYLEEVEGEGWGSHSQADGTQEPLPPGAEAVRPGTSATLPELPAFQGAEGAAAAGSEDLFSSRSECDL